MRITEPSTPSIDVVEADEDEAAGWGAWALYEGFVAAIVTDDVLGSTIVGEDEPLIAAVLISVAEALEAHPELAARLVRALGLVPTTPADETIPLSEVKAHGAPSAAWVQGRARRGQIEILGPRGGRFVRSADLRSLLAATTIVRRVTSAPRPPSVNDARSAVVDLAARRKRTG